MNDYSNIIKEKFKNNNLDDLYDEFIFYKFFFKHYNITIKTTSQNILVGVFVSDDSDVLLHADKELLKIIKDFMYQYRNINIYIPNIPIINTHTNINDSIFNLEELDNIIYNIYKQGNNPKIIVTNLDYLYKLVNTMKPDVVGVMNVDFICKGGITLSTYKNIPIIVSEDIFNTKDILDNIREIDKKMYVFDDSDDNKINQLSHYFNVYYQLDNID